MSTMLIGFITMAALIYTVVMGGFIGYPLLLGLVLFSGLAYKQGNPISTIINLLKHGARKALVVLRVFVFIGLITGAWLSSGTVAGLISLGLDLLHPQWFILFAFLIPAFVSFLLGTALGTVSTVGVALIIIGRGSGLPEAMVAGAIISGAYFGDRNSPMSSSANLVATLTGTNLHQNVIDMFKTALVPLGFTLVFYSILAHLYPLSTGEMPLISALDNTFDLSPLALLPAAIMLVLAFTKIDVKWAMGISIIVACFVSIFLQANSVFETISAMLFGFELPSGHALALLIKGGGLVSMIKPGIIVTTACALAGLMEGTKMLATLEDRLTKLKSPRARFGGTLGISLVSAGLGSNQTIGIVFTEQIMAKAYGDKHRDLAIGIENSAVLLAAIIPWNIAALVPTTTLGVHPYSFIPYAIFLFCVPLYHWWIQPLPLR